MSEKKRAGESRRKVSKGLVLRQIRGRNDVVRGVVLRHKGHTIERPCMVIGD